ENTEHLNTTKITPSYWQQSVNFCHRNQGTVMLLLGIGIFSGLKALQTLQEIQPSNDTSYGV
ncbi:MAG TPA: hypothetical protein VHD33_07055, partial [Legionellaceae bacterium]|nr:hypothetical protein [Legionellaceae bacterium]